MMKKISRFTLIEAVILIGISLILTMLVLGLRQARENARRISCMNNLKCMGLSMRMYSNVYNEAYPNRDGRAGLQMLASEGFLENTNVYTCPSTKDVVPNIATIWMTSSYAYAGGLNEASSVDSGMASDRSFNHRKYGNIVFVDGHAKGYTGSSWSSNRGGSHLGDF